MNLLNKILLIILSLFLYPLSLILWPNILHLKKHLYDHKDGKFLFKKCLIAIYEKRLSNKGSWIGYSATL